MLGMWDVWCGMFAGMWDVDVQLSVHETIGKFQQTIS